MPYTKILEEWLARESIPYTISIPALLPTRNKELRFWKVPENKLCACVCVCMHVHRCKPMCASMSTYRNSTVSREFQSIGDPCFISECNSEKWKDPRISWQTPQCRSTGAEKSAGGPTDSVVLRNMHKAERRCGSEEVLQSGWRGAAGT